MTLKKILTVVMDGIGERASEHGNAVKIAHTPNLSKLGSIGAHRQLIAHGTAVGLPSDKDMGNSEVGHNALGGGRVYDQGAKLVSNAIATRRIFKSKAWKAICKQLSSTKGTLHLIGLLSDGNVHSHQDHLHALMRQAKDEQINKVRLHTLFDGRDVSPKSSKIYIDRLESAMSNLRSDVFDISVASGGGRMTTTMDRYSSDWNMVKRGWQAHTHANANYEFSSLSEAAETFYNQDPTMTDQNFPAFVIRDTNGTKSPITSGDAVVLFNFRGDRAIQISRAFTESSFSEFDRGEVPDVLFAGMMEYEGDLHIPKNYLVEPPEIKSTLGELLADAGVRQFACSETQKYGHVTYFWNGNRTGKFSDSLEEYLEIPSDPAAFDNKPWMKALEITDATIQRLYNNTFDFGRINLANGDMVGHTGNLDAAVVAVSTVDLMIGRLIQACADTNTTLIVTADHGNCDEMLEDSSSSPKPKVKTSHSLSPVPFYVYDPECPGNWEIIDTPAASIGNLASSVLTLMDLPAPKDYLESLIRKRS